MITVEDVMSPIQQFFSPGDMLSRVVASMSKKRLSCALICEQQMPVGIITERDLVRVFARQLSDQRFQDFPINELMTNEPVCVLEKTPVLDALLLARSRKVRHLPVVNESEALVGILTQNDAIDAYLKSIEHNTKLKADYEALKLLSLEDPLVGAGNRRALEVDLGHAKATAKRYHRPFCVAMFDVDYFKAYNDHYGHQKGDDALVSLVDLIRANMREVDRIYRYGGEEFLLLMPNTELDQGFIVAERIRKALEAAKLPHTKSPLDCLTLSAGVAMHKKGTDVIELADQALYKAKREGRNQTRQTIC